jgi:hypothetical protein
MLATLDADFVAGMAVLFAKMEALEDQIAETEIRGQQWL